MVRGLVAVPAGYDRCRAFGSFGSARPISILWLGPLPPQTDTGAVPQIGVPSPAPMRGSSAPPTFPHSEQWPSGKWCSLLLGVALPGPPLF